MSRPRRPLSPREVQVLDLISRGYSDKDVADALQIAPKTVAAHRWRIYQELGVHNAAHAVRVAIERRVIKINSELREVA